MWLLAVLLPGVCLLQTDAQTLARPGWAGSGLAAEAWWRNAVFYRIDVERFQDADGDGVGDLRGVSSRLDYLQSLGVDAVVLQPPFNDDEGFDLLLREASAQHIRVLISLGEADVKDGATLLASARRWLTRGAAGMVVPSALLRSGLLARSPSLLRDLHTLTASVPGQRALLALPEAGSGARLEVLAAGSADLAGLSTDVPQVETDAPFPAALRKALVDVQTPPNGSAPLLFSDNCCRTADAETFAGDRARSLGMSKITAARLLTSRGAVALLYGQELGLVDAKPEDRAPVMAWTPGNVTLGPVAQGTETAAVQGQAAAAAPAAPAALPPGTFGEFRPYVPPKPVRKPTTAEAQQEAFAALPGFSTKSGGPVSTSADAKSTAKMDTVNAAAEDADPGSLLNFYRRLSQLHHGNSSLRSGTPYVLDHDREQALVWIRRAPAGARTAATVVVTCNLGAKPLTLSLRSDFERLHIRAGVLRPLLASWTQTPSVQPADSVQLPPYSVLLGELYHDAR